MEPTTIALIASASVLSLVGGVVIGRVTSRGDAPEQKPPLPATNTNHLKRIEDLREENAALREVLTMPPRAGLEKGPISGQVERLDEALRELRSRKFTRAAAVFDAKGLELRAKGEDDAVGVLGALAGALTSFGEAPDALEWSSTRGAHLRVERLEVGEHDLVLGVWTDGQPATRSATASARAILTGHIEPVREHSAKARLRVGGEAPPVLEEMASALPLTRLALVTPEHEELAFGDELSGDRRAARGAMWRWASALGAARARLGIGEVTALHVYEEGSRSSAYQVPGRDRTLWLTMPASTPSSDARIDGWLGQLRHQLHVDTALKLLPPSNPSPDVRRGAQP